MPSTKELVNYVKMNANGWQRTGERGILPLLSYAQDLLLQQEGQQSILSKVGDFPLLVTSDGVYEYDVDTTNLPSITADEARRVWRIGGVLLKVPINDALRVVILGEYGLGPEVKGPIEKYRYNGKEYFRFQQISTEDRIYDTPAKVKFKINPGNTTDDFYLLSFLGPVPLTSERVNPSVPERLHFKALLPATIRLVEAFQTNAWDKAILDIGKVYQPMVLHEYLNAGEQGESYSVQRRRI